MAGASELSLIKPDFPCMSPHRGAHSVVKEPASERFDHRKSTSVAGRGSSSQRSRPARTLCDHPLVFRAGSGIVRGTHTFVSPNPSPGGGRGRWTRSHQRRAAVMVVAYAARGIAA